jgi:hypothetical protein
MKRQGTMHAHQLEKFARFLEEHPGFSPLLIGEDALLCGFQVGGSLLRIEELERLIAPPAAVRCATGGAAAGPVGCPCNGQPIAILSEFYEGMK